MAGPMRPAITGLRLLERRALVVVLRAVVFGADLRAVVRRAGDLRATGLREVLRAVVRLAVDLVVDLRAVVFGADLRAVFRAAGLRPEVLVAVLRAVGRVVALRAVRLAGLLRAVERLVVVLRAAVFRPEVRAGVRFTAVLRAVVFRAAVLRAAGLAVVLRAVVLRAVVLGADLRAVVDFLAAAVVRLAAGLRPEVLVAVLVARVLVAADLVVRALVVRAVVVARWVVVLRAAGLADFLAELLRAVGLAVDLVADLRAEVFGALLRALGLRPEVLAARLVVRLVVVRRVDLRVPVEAMDSLLASRIRRCRERFVRPGDGTSLKTRAKTRPRSVRVPLVRCTSVCALVSGPQIDHI